MGPLLLLWSWWYITHVYPRLWSCGSMLLSLWLSVRLSVEKWFPYDNSISFWHTMMILHTCIAHDWWIAHDWRNTSIDFGVKKSKVKVKSLTLKFESLPHDNSSALKTSIDFRVKNFAPFPHNNPIIFWHTMMILDACVARYLRSTSIDLGLRGQRSRSDLVFELCIIFARKM